MGEMSLQSHPPPQPATSLMAKVSRQGNYEYDSSPFGQAAPRHVQDKSLGYKSYSTHHIDRSGQFLPTSQLPCKDSQNDSIFTKQKYLPIPDISPLILGNSWCHKKTSPEDLIGCGVPDQSLTPFCPLLFTSLYYSILFTRSQYQKYLFI